MFLFLLLTKGYKIENGLRDKKIPDDLTNVVHFRANSLFFRFKNLTPSEKNVVLTYNVNPNSTHVFNCDLATGTLAKPDPKYMDSKMTISEFLERSNDYSQYLLDPITAKPLDIDPVEFWKGRKRFPYFYKFYNPEVVVERRVIPFSELQLITE